MNHLSLSPSLPPATVSLALSSSLTLLLSPHPSSHFILVCLSVSSCRLTDTTYWFKMRFECWRGRRGRGGGRLICILFPFMTQPPSGLDPASPNISFVLTQLFTWCLKFCNLWGPAALSSDGTVWGWHSEWMLACVCFHANHMRNACDGADPAPKCC